MLAYIYHAIFRVGGKVGVYLKYSPLAAKIFVVVGKMCGKILKESNIVLKCL